MTLSGEQLARMIDISAVKADSTRSEVEAIINAARKYQFIAVFTLPCFASYAKSLMVGESEILLGGTVGFPSGSSTTETKAFEASELLGIGCDELDMVINIGKLKSKLYDDVATDIREIVKTAGYAPVKVILEVSLLTNDEIDAGAKIVRDSGARFVKTGTGWSGPTTIEHIQTIKQAIGDSIDIKVAGGVRHLDILLKIHEMGVSRFGLGHEAAITMMKEFSKKYLEPA